MFNRLRSRPSSSGRKRSAHTKPHFGLIHSCFGKTGAADRFPMLAAFGNLRKSAGDGVDANYMDTLEKLCGTNNALEEHHES